MVRSLLAADSTATGIEVTVVLSQLLGAETIVEVDYGAGRVFARVDNPQQMEVQQPMSLSVDPQHIHFLIPSRSWPSKQPSSILTIRDCHDEGPRSGVAPTEACDKVDMHCGSLQ